MANPLIMHKSKLEHGDVLLFAHAPEHQSLFVRGIRLVTGSTFVHAGVVVDNGQYKLVLEQLAERTFEPVDYYRPDVGASIHVLRPKFDVPPTDPSLINRNGYGYWSIADCLANHLVGLFSKRDYKVRFGKIKPDNVECAGLVAQALGLQDRALWCKDNKVVEPDDYFNHDETFWYLGVVDWS